MTLTKRFVRVVRAALARSRTSIRALAHRTHLSERTVYQVLSGRQKVSLDQADEIAQALDVPASELVAEAEGLAEGRA